MELEKTTAERLLLVVPALILTFVRLVAIDAEIILPADDPKVTPLALEKASVWKVKLPLEALAA